MLKREGGKYFADYITKAGVSALCFRSYATTYMTRKRRIEYKLQVEKNYYSNTNDKQRMPVSFNTKES